MHIIIKKWQGIKGDTGIVSQGYLWINFLEDTTLINTNPIYALPMAPSYYTKGQCIGFPIHGVSNRQQAVKSFMEYYKEEMEEPVSKLDLDISNANHDQDYEEVAKLSNYKQAQ